MIGHFSIYLASFACIAAIYQTSSLIPAPPERFVKLVSLFRLLPEISTAPVIDLVIVVVVAPEHAPEPSPHTL
jgi:hypothetical protein